MSKKLLVITAGTVAAGVGRTIVKQMSAHPSSELNVMVRCIDTAYLPNRYPKLRPGEWFQMSINPRYMQAINQNITNFPRLQNLLFDGLLPGTDVQGGGGIRYNGAGAVEVKREELRKWLSASMTDLAHSGDRDTSISIALILSAVGATGSGSLEHLVEVIVDAAYYAGIRSTAQATIRCDTYILQPSQDVTDLGLANTLALYAELAASQLSQTTTRSYQGRKVMIGWGSTRALSSIEQLREAAATIIRLSSDPSSAFAAEFQEREVDNHVLRELDPLTFLPMHLSLVTAVTINLGRLEEQVIQRDVTRLIDNLVFQTSSASSQSNILLGKFADSLAGEIPEDRYQKLLDFLSETIGLSDMRKQIDNTASNKGIPDGEKGTKLMRLWRDYAAEIKQGHQKIEDNGRLFVHDAINELEQAKRDRICKGGVSLTELREEYRSLQAVLASALAVARNDVKTTVDDGPVKRAQQQVEGLWPFRLFNRAAKLRRLAAAINDNLQACRQESARSSAIDVLEKLEQHCAEIGRNLDIVLNKLRKQRDSEQKEAAKKNKTKFSVDVDNPLNIVALPTVDEMESYAAQVSLFAEGQSGDQIAEFRQWLQNRTELDELFKGDLDRVLVVVTGYAQEKVHQAIQKYSVLDILQRAGEHTLLQRITEASARANSLVSYSEDFAPGRRQAWHVSAYWGDDEDQREELQKVINVAFPQGQCKLLSSSDPTEMAVFYYVDGIPISAIDDLKGRCLNAFLQRRQQWQQQEKSLNGNSPISSINSLNQRVGVPVFSGKDAERRVRETCVVKRLYGVKGEEVGDYKVEDIPELDCSNTPTKQISQQNGHHAPDHQPPVDQSSTVAMASDHQPSPEQGVN